MQEVIDSSAVVTACRKYESELVDSKTCFKMTIGPFIFHNNNNRSTRANDHNNDSISIHTS